MTKHILLNHCNALSALCMEHKLDRSISAEGRVTALYADKGNRDYIIAVDCLPKATAYLIASAIAQSAQKTTETAATVSAEQL